MLLEIGTKTNMKIKHTPFGMGHGHVLEVEKGISRGGIHYLAWSRDSTYVSPHFHRDTSVTLSRITVLLAFPFNLSDSLDTCVCLHELKGKGLSVMTLSEIYLLLVLLVFPSRLLVSQTITVSKITPLSHFPSSALNTHHCPGLYFPGVTSCPFFPRGDPLEGFPNLLHSPVQVSFLVTALTVGRTSELVWWFRWVVYLGSQLLRFFQRLTHWRRVLLLPKKNFFSLNRWTPDPVWETRNYIPGDPRNMWIRGAFCGLP